MTFAEAKRAMKERKGELDDAIRAGEWDLAMTLAHQLSERRLGDVAGIAFEESRS